MGGQLVLYPSRFCAHAAILPLKRFDADMVQTFVALFGVVPVADRNFWGKFALTPVSPVVVDTWWVATA